MKSQLIKSGYLFDSKTNVWSRSDYVGIAYNDGDEFENRLANILEHAKDISVLSSELRKHCIDWPSIYHLSSNRANILRPFQHSLSGADVLEIGAGCGAITRYLGECNANVLALEGAQRRAAIARSRTRDLDNVQVLMEKFDEFVFCQQFDVITLIGVLEYANVYMMGTPPALAMLQRLRSMLKPDGILIVAIENQLGLKYFAGAAEDHLGQSMYGIEGRYKNHEPETYGREVLTQFLTQAGFLNSQFLAPFPDYKLPVSIITEQGFSCKIFDKSALISTSVRADPQLPPTLAFSPELVWPNLLKNGVALDFSNSFLIVASNQQQFTFSPNVLAYHYSTQRHSEFCKETILKFKKSDTIIVNYNLISSSNNGSDNPYFIHRLEQKETEYICGKLLLSELQHIVTCENWHMEDVGNFLKKYLVILTDILSKKNRIIQVNSIDALLPGECIDLLPQNIIIREDGEACAIDLEWFWLQPFTIGHLLFRALFSLVNSLTRFGKPSHIFPLTRRSFFVAAYKSIGFEVDESKINSYFEMEKTFQTQVVKEDNKAFSVYQLDFPINIYSLNGLLTERENRYADLNKEVEDVSNWGKLQHNKAVALEQMLSDKQNELMKISDWAQSMMFEFNRREVSIAFRAGKIVRRGAVLARKKLAKSPIGHLVRYVRNNRLYREKKVSLEAIRQSILDNQGKLIITFPIITWNFRWQRPQHMVSLLRDSGFSILYVAMTLTPLMRQFRNNKDALAHLQFNGLATHINKIWLNSSKKLDIYNDCIEGDDLLNILTGFQVLISELRPKSILYLVQFPTWGPVAQALRKKLGGTIVFDCMDDHSGFSTSTSQVVRAEKELLEQADFVITSSDSLEARAKHINANTIQVKNGTEFEHFANATYNGTLEHLRHQPTIGYFGAISDWFDTQLIAYCALQRPDWNFVLIGSTYGADLQPISGLSNIHLLGEKLYQDLPGYLAYFDVCTIPFKLTPLTMATNPVKFYEYISAGKPVVSVELPELFEYKEDCYLARNPEDFLVKLECAYHERHDEFKIEQRLKLARDNSWSARGRTLLESKIFHSHL